MIGTERATDVDSPVVRVARLSADGYLDRSFGDAGVARVDFWPFASGSTGDAIAVLGDGRFVVAGKSSTQSGVALARLLSDGSLDTSFGYGGWITTTSTASHGTLHVAADGKLVVTTGWEVLRYNADGFLDEGFALGGRKTFPISIVGIGPMFSAPQPDGKLVFAGVGFRQTPGVGRLLMDGPSTTTTLRSSTIPSSRGQPVTLTATVAGANLSGAVRFMDGSDPIMGCEAIPLSGPIAVCAYAASTAGQHVLRAVYYENISTGAPVSASFDLVQVVSETGGAAAIEFYHGGYNHYFVTSLPDEVAKLDAGIRYYTDSNTRTGMASRGWIAEGNGAEKAFACVPLP